ncbi:MAG: flagellar biosynthesis anti-sigma factor FlgM [Chloroherpetonaceae bacterium]|nr:flagellar biosynthesis anti-sigma factor FlgM [Chthonomonadaceae bacterium]MDW8207994.1 flagellar biosynthesis anti-sigma factor FlgM [Chloroherpetonaceae bacterium]
MKISSEEVGRLLATAPSGRGNARVATTPASPAQESSGSREAALVEVSPTAQEIQQIKRLVHRLPDVREDRVRSLKAQIESGTYHVSGEDIADLMIRRMLADNSLL